MKKSELENGYYWIRINNIGWVIAEYDECLEEWCLTTGQIYKTNEISEIDTNAITR